MAERKEQKKTERHPELQETRKRRLAFLDMLLQESEDDADTMTLGDIQEEVYTFTAGVTYDL